MKNTVLSVFTWVLFISLTVLLWASSLICFILFGLWDKARRSGHFCERCWAWTNLKSNPFWKLTIDRRARLDPKRTYIFVANHQSLTDIIVLLCVNHTFKYVAKASIAQIPFLGWDLKLNRHIVIERDSLRSTYIAMEEAKKWIARSISVAFFAEGTRSRTGKMAPFKRGAFKLAIETGTPIVPVAITGTRDALPRGTWRFLHKVSGVMTILEPIETYSYRIKDSDELRQQVFDQISNVLTSNGACSESFNEPGG
jgi:1-acyl-sn-glycerol-3-phosphate acyltransferase